MITTPEVAERTVSPNLGRILRTVRHRGLLVATCVVLATGAALGFSALQTKRYTATASLLFRNPVLAQQASGVSVVNQNDPQGDRSTNVRLVELGNAASGAAAALGGGLTPKRVRDSVHVSAQGQSDVVSVSAKWTGPRRAADIANAFAHAFIAERQRSARESIASAIGLVEQQYGALTPRQRATSQGQDLRDRAESLRILSALQTGNAELVQSATAPSSPASPKPVRNAIVGGVLGLLLGLGLAYLWERLDRRLREPEEISAAFAAPMLGIIPHGQWDPSVNGNDARRGRVDLEPFFMLRANLRYFDVSRRVRSVLVTSAASAEGKTTTAWSLSVAAASMGTRTLLIEGDLRRPSLSVVPGLASETGLARAIVVDDSAAGAIQSVPVQTRTNGSSEGRALDVLVAGAVPPNPGELLESESMGRLLEWAEEQYELVVIDTPPLSVVADAVPLIKRVDGVIVVSRLGRSTRDGLGRLRDRLEHLDAPVLGVVVNDAGRGADYGYGYAQ
jgi:succinoglycan biosynthesis transport protein ExoP